MTQEFLGRSALDWHKVFLQIGKSSIQQALEEEMPLHVRQCDFAEAVKRRFPRTVPVKFAPGKQLASLQLYGLTLASIVEIFHNLGLEKRVWPSKHQLMQAYHLKQTSWERNTSPTKELVEKRVLMKQARKQIAMGAGRLQWLADCEESVEALYNERFQLQHQGLPEPLPLLYLRRYKEETGEDVEARLAVNAVSGLSAVACCFPGCGHYLKTLSPSMLKAHLKPILIPGFHKTVLKHRQQSAASVAEQISKGLELLPPPLSKAQSRALQKLGAGAEAEAEAHFRAKNQRKLEDMLAIERPLLEGYVQALMEQPVGSYEAFCSRLAS
jgi:hypothetical protein